MGAASFARPVLSSYRPVRGPEVRFLCCSDAGEELQEARLHPGFAHLRVHSLGVLSPSRTGESLLLKLLRAMLTIVTKTLATSTTTTASSASGATAAAVS